MERGRGYIGDSVFSWMWYDGGAKELQMRERRALWVV